MWFSLLQVALFVTGGAATPSCHYNSILPRVSGFGDRKQGRVKINQRFVCSNGELIRYRANDGHPQPHLVITGWFPQFPPIRTSLPLLKMIKHIVIDYLPIMLVCFNFNTIEKEQNQKALTKSFLILLLLYTLCIEPVNWISQNVICDVGLLLSKMEVDFASLQTWRWMKWETLGWHLQQRA